MTKPLPSCGTCPHALAGDNEGDRWCHGAPPTATVSIEIRHEEGKEPETTTHHRSFYPPVGVNMVGCTLHPKWPRRRWWWPFGRR